MTTAPDAPEIEIRINDHILVTYKRTGPNKWWDADHYRDNYDYDIWVISTLGDASIQYHITGSLCTVLNDWVLHEISVDIGGDQDSKDPLAKWDFENLDIPLKQPGNESLRTWIKRAREKGNF